MNVDNIIILQYHNIMNLKNPKQNPVIVPATVAQHKLGDIFDLVERGKTIIFTKYGSEIGELRPSISKKEVEKRLKEKDDLLKLIASQKTTGKTVDTTRIIRKMRDDSLKKLERQWLGH